MRRMNTAAVLAVVLAVAMMLTGCFGWKLVRNDEGGSVEVGSHTEEEPVNTPVIVEEGTSGTCSWTIDDTGLLHIFPTDGDFGELEPDHEYQDEDSDVELMLHKFGWHPYGDQIMSCVIENGVWGTDFQYMFEECANLKSVDLSGLDTSQAEDMAYMFCNCQSLESLDLSDFDTSGVMYMNDMFENCESLETLDLSSFDTSNVEYMDSMFLDCSALKTIIVGDGWTTDNIGYVSFFDLTLDYDMFTGCVSLVGGNGTTYDENMIDSTYARIDEPGQPGYFTASGASANETVTHPGADDYEPYAVDEPTVQYELDDYILSTHGLYVLNSDGRTVSPVLSNGCNRVMSVDSDLFHSYNDEVEGQQEYILYMYYDPVSFDRNSGQQLILIGDTSVEMDKVIESGYCQGQNVDGRYNAYDEIEGINLEGVDEDSINDAIESLGIRWNSFYDRNYGGGTFADVFDLYQSSTPRTLSAGWYEGTQWVDGSLELIYPYCIVERPMLESDDVPLTKTKDGYFILDLSSYEPGVYRLYSAGSGDVFIELN